MSLVLALRIRINDKCISSINNFNSLPTIPFLWVRVFLVYLLTQILINRNYVLSNLIYVYMSHNKK